VRHAKQPQMVEDAYSHKGRPEKEKKNNAIAMQNVNLGCLVA
jgi:hypothetical protein